MSDTKHTPGEWKIVRPFGRAHDAIMVGDKRIAGIGHTTVSYEEAEANARLIAAAPELLAACKLALGAFEYNNAIDWDDLSRAIAKAEGRNG